MANVKIKVLRATVIDGKGKTHKQGDECMVDEKSAKHLESIRYAKIVSKKAAAKDDGDDKGGDGDTDNKTKDGE